MFQLPDNVAFIIKKLQKNGYEAYAVGGCVRDSVINKQPNDWDITTSALPEQIKNTFCGMRTVDTGIKHGTVTVLLNGIGYEVTTYRTDGAYSDHRRPDSVEFVNNLRLDLERRDFTINAMASNDGLEIIDYFGGIDDLNNKTIRCVGDPEKRFEEDALRILRALRFASCFDFIIENNTAEAANKLCNTLAMVSAERIFIELKKLICGKGAARIIAEYKDVLLTVLPEIRNVKSAELNALGLVPQTPVYRLAVLFSIANISAEEAKNALLRLKSDTQTIIRVCTMLAESRLNVKAEPLFIKKQLIRLGRDAFLDEFPILKALDFIVYNSQNANELDKAENIAIELSKCSCLKISELNINGNDLKSVGINGRDIGYTLNRLLELVAEEKLKNDAQELLRMAKLLRDEKATAT